MRFRTLFSLPIAGIVLLGMSGCSHANHAQVEWTKALRQMGIAPAYPPREDMYVGDVYLTTYDPDSKATRSKFEHGDLNIGIEPRFAHVDITKQLVTDYTDRFIFPETPDANSGQLTSTEVKIWREPALTGNASIFTGQASQPRLRVVEMPDFTNVVLTKASAAATFPIEGVTTSASTAFGKFNQVVLKIPAAESYSVDSAFLLDQIVKDGRLKDDYAKNVVGNDAGFVWLKVITEVYYARAIDITGSDRTAMGASVKAQPGPGNDDSAQDIPCGEITTNAPTTTMPAVKGIPSGTLVATHCDSSSLTMRRVFPQPIAIGTRGFVLKVHMPDQQVMGMSPMNGSTPAAIRSDSL